MNIMLRPIVGLNVAVTSGDFMSQSTESYVLPVHLEILY